MSVLLVENLKVNYPTDGLLDCVGDGANLINASGCAIQPSPPDGHSSRVEEDSIQININRESLKKKLLLRRTLPELVNQGIHPPLNVPPAFADRQRHLQRAQTGDRLRQKLKERPDRECLVQHHILEDTSVLVDRSLQEKQRLLKRSQLQSDLSGRLASRPGPLELVTKNILQIDPQLKDGLIEGKIPFPKTTEVNDPVRHISYPDFFHDDDDFGLGLDSSQLDNSLGYFSLVAVPDDSLPEGICCTPTEGTSERVVATSNSFSLPPGGLCPIKSPKSSTAPSIPPAPDIKPLLSGRKFHLVSPQLLPAPAFNFASSGDLQLQPLSASQGPFGGDAVTSSDDSVSAAAMASNSRKMTKKPKNKNITKSRMIKFHEYKGPPSVLKMNSRSRAELQHEPPTPTSTPYGVLLEQQQMFLQWQLDFQQKALLSWQKSETTTAAALPVASTAAAAAPSVALSNPAPSETVQSAAVGSSGVFNFMSSPLSVAPTTSKPLLRLEDMKATYLRSECRRLGLPSHGSKPQLIERLVPQLSRINLNTRCAVDPAASFRNSDSSLSSASSEVASPVAATMDSSFSGNQFGVLSGQKPPVTMDVGPTHPLSMFPANVDQSTGQSTGGYIRPVPPPAFVLVRASPQVSQASVHQGQVPRADVSPNNHVMPQVYGITRPVPVPSRCFGSMPVAQPVMLFTQPLETHPMTQAVKEAADAATQPARQAVRPAAPPRSEGISSEEMVVRQQRMIASLELSLQEYQRKLLLTEQRALLQQMQLSTLAQGDNASPNGEGKSDIDAKNAFDEKGDVTSPGLSYGNAACGHRLLSQSKPYDFNATGNSTVSNIGNGFSASEPVLHSAADPFLPISHSNSFYGSTATDSYIRLPNVISDSLVKPMLSSQCNTFEDMFDFLYKKGELMLPICDDHLDASNPKESSMNFNDGGDDGDDKRMFFLPDSDCSDLAPGPEIDVSTFSTAGSAFPFNSRTAAAFARSGNLPPVQHAACDNVQKMDLCFATPEPTCADGSFDAIDSLFGNMEWSDLDLDLLTSQMDGGQSLLDNAYRANRNFDLDVVGDVDWMGRSGDAVPPTFAPCQNAALSSVTPYPGNDCLSLIRQGEEQDFFYRNKSDPFLSADLSAMIGFEMLADGETSKTRGAV